MAFNNRDYSIDVLQNLKKYIVAITKAIDDTTDVATVTWNDTLFEIKDNYPNSDFYLKTEKIYLERADAITYDVKCYPSTNGKRGVQKFNMAAKSMPDIIASWVHNIRLYNDISILPEQNFEKFYEDEFASFTIINEDADVNPHTSENQQKIRFLLDRVIENLKENAPDNLEVILLAENIKETLSISTKAKVAASIAKLFAKIRIIGGNAILGLKNLLISEAPKILLKKGADEFFKYLDDL